MQEFLEQQVGGLPGCLRPGTREDSLPRFPLSKVAPGHRQQTVVEGSGSTSPA